MKLSIPAWHDDQYLSLCEMLLAIGWPLRALDWHLDIEEAAMEPGAEALERVAPKQAHSLFELLKLTTPGIQIIDGEITGISRDKESFIRIQAIDSTSWEVESNISETLAALRFHFPDAMEVP